MPGTAGNKLASTPAGGISSEASHTDMATWLWDAKVGKCLRCKQASVPWVQLLQVTWACEQTVECWQGEWGNKSTGSDLCDVDRVPVPWVGCWCLPCDPPVVGTR